MSEIWSFLVGINEFLLFKAGPIGVGIGILCCVALAVLEAFKAVEKWRER